MHDSVTISAYQLLRLFPDQSAAREHNHIPLGKWLLTVYMVVTAQKGISSLQLSKELSITQHSAWFLLDHLCEVLDAGDPGGGRLNGTVEVDEVFIGGKEGNRHARKKLKAGHGTAGKQAVVGMPIENTQKEMFCAAIAEHVEPGSEVHTDEYSKYEGLPNYVRKNVKNGAGGSSVLAISTSTWWKACGPS